MSGAALKLVRDELARDQVVPKPKPPPHVQMNLSVRAPVRDEVDRLAKELGWSKVRVVSVAVQALSRLLSEG